MKLFTYQKYYRINEKKLVDYSPDINLDNISITL